MSDDILRVYLDPAEIAPDGYPEAWHRGLVIDERLAKSVLGTVVAYQPIYGEPIKDLIRERDGHRCLRCKHPYTKGDGEWSRCDEQCTHGGPWHWRFKTASSDDWIGWELPEPPWASPEGRAVIEVEAAWRILTVHHLNGIKHDCRWWNLVSLCQRCHLTIQAKVHLARSWSKPHSEWFQPYAAGFYAWKYLDLELSREETIARLDELLALEQTQDPLF